MNKLKFWESSEQDKYDEKISIMSSITEESSWDDVMLAVDSVESFRTEKGDACRFTIDMDNVNIEGTDIDIMGGSLRNYSDKKQSCIKAIKEFLELVK